MDSRQKLRYSGGVLRNGVWATVCIGLLGGSWGCSSVCPSISAAEKQAFRQARPEEGGYVINPGDGLQIEVWENPQLTRTVSVRPDGKITLPLVNDVAAARQTVPQFQAKLTSRLKTYIKDPIVSITVTQFSGKQIYLQGQIRRPSAYPFSGDMYLLQALAIAGGTSAFAEGCAVVVRRRGEQFVRYDVPLEPLLTGESLKENIVE